MSPEEVQALLKKELIKSTGGNPNALPRPIQLGPLRWYDTADRCAHRGCSSPTMIKIRGISYCMSHALTKLNEIILTELEHIDLSECTCNSGKHSNGNIHSVECQLYQLEKGVVSAGL